MAGARPSKRSRLTDDDSDDDDEDTFVFQYSEEGQCTPTASTTHCMWQCVSALEELKQCRNAVNGGKQPLWPTLPWPSGCYNSPQPAISYRLPCTEQ
jgi:hypothetical protein